MLAVYHASYTESLNETIDVATTREVAGIYARVPETVLLLLFVGSALTLGMVGYSAGLTGRRSPLTAIALIVVLGAVITLIIDIERPQGGTLTVSQLPLVQLQEQIGPPAPRRPSRRTWLGPSCGSSAVGPSATAGGRAVYPIHARTSSGCSAAVAHMLWEPLRLERRRLRGSTHDRQSGEGLYQCAVREHDSVGAGKRVSPRYPAWPTGSAGRPGR